MIVVTGVVEIDAEHVWPATTAAGKMIEATQKEEGCITYSFYVDITDQRKFRIYEEWASEEALAAHMERQCLKEHLKPEDMIDPTLYLASNASRMMTGQCMAVDGGVVVSG